MGIQIGLSFEVRVLKLTTENNHWDYAASAPPAAPCDSQDIGGGWLRQLLRVP